MAEANTTAPASAPANAGAATSTPAPAGTSDTTAIGGGEQKPPEGQTALGQQPQGEGEKGGQGEPAKAKPVELKLPEGVTVAPEFLKEYQDLVGKFDPQKGLDFVLKAQETALADLQKQVTEQVKQQQTAWLESARADKEIGGSAWDATLTSARTAVARLGGDALRDVLNKTGLGNHPEIIRAFAKAGKALSEDSIAGRAGNAAPEGEDLSKLTPQERLARVAYPTMKSTQNKE